MAYYEIIETPGKKKVYPLSAGDERNGETLEDDDSPLRNQDEAKIVVNRFRAEAKKAGRKVDFIVRRDTDRVAATASTGTSIRLTEENRSMVARFCGRVMMETGETVSMGDAVAKLAKVASVALDRGIVDFKGELDEDAVIKLARSIQKARKEAAA